MRQFLINHGHGGQMNPGEYSTKILLARSAGETM